MTSASDRYQEKSDKKEHTMRNSSTPPLLRLEDICVKFGFVEALKSVNLSIQRQEVIAIVGDNGAGKSTLIKVIAGFLQPGFGHIYLNGEQVTIPSIREADRMGIASVFQGQEFCDNLDVASNLFLGKEINQIGIRDDDSMNSACPFRAEDPELGDSGRLPYRILIRRPAPDRGHSAHAAQ